MKSFISILLLVATGAAKAAHLNGVYSVVSGDKGCGSKVVVGASYNRLSTPGMGYVNQDLFSLENQSIGVLINATEVTSKEDLEEKEIYINKTDYGYFTGTKFVVPARPLEKTPDSYTAFGPSITNWLISGTIIDSKDELLMERTEGGLFHTKNMNQSDSLDIKAKSDNTFMLTRKQKNARSNDVYQFQCVIESQR